MMIWQTTRFRIDLARPQVMGIVNITPDSFSDGGRSAAAAIAHCEQLLAEGADLLDLGGESTRPGSLPVSVDEELARVLPVLDAALTLGCPVSVDTNKPEVMRAVLARGADIVNDINALQAPGALDAVSAHPSCGVCLMHMRGDPATMQQRPQYDDVLAEVSEFLGARLHALRQRGIADARIVLDPGIGFGKTPEQSMTVLARLNELSSFGLPLLVGASRKRFISTVTPSEPHQRLGGSIAAHLVATQKGARIIRAHDVAETVQALRVAAAIRDQE